MKQKNLKRIQGSVSIFLVIILIPMVCTAGLIVDGSRVELAKAQVSTAGDLVMNSALANYDTVLKEVYGLFAMSQNEAQLSTNLYNYFVSTLMANGIVASEEEVQANPLLQDIAMSFSGKTSNLLSMDIDQKDFTVKKLDNSSLAQSSILKNQIVEYEKYRAPIGTALSLLDGIASLKKILKQSKVNKAKTTVDEKAGEVNKKGNDLYEALKKYVAAEKTFDKKYETFDPNGKNGSNADYALLYNLSDPSWYRPGFAVIMPAYVRTLAENMPFSLSISKESDGSLTIYGLHIESHSNGEYSAHFVNTDNLAKITNKANNAWGYDQRATNEELLEEFRYAYEVICSGTVQDAQHYLSQVSNINTLSLADKRAYSTAYVMYMQKLLNVLTFYKLYVGQAKPEEFSVQVTVNYEDVTVTDQDIKNILDTAKVFSDRLHEYELIFNKECWQRGDVVEALAAEISADLKWFEDNDILATLKTIVTEIGKLETAINNLDTANNALHTQIDAYNGSDNGDAFSNQMQQDYEYYKENIDPAKVAALKVKMEALESYFVLVKAYLEGLKFIDVSLKECNTLYNTVLMTRKHKTDCGLTVEEYVEAHYTEGVDAISTYLKTQYKEEKTAPTKLETNIDDDEFWQYLQQAYGVTKTKEDEQAESDKDSMKEAAKDTAATGSTNPYNEVALTQEIINLLPSQGSYTAPSGDSSYDGGEQFSSLFDKITSMLSSLLEGMKKAATTGRDNLYVTQYVFDMFSYNTMEAEYKVEHGKDAEIKIETPSGIAISASNNYMYGAEAEYIIYGGFDAAQNIKTAKGWIFGIRFLANSVYALTNSEIKAITLPPALAVQAATLGVVPYKLTQVVLQLCLALGESLNDLRLMEEGKKVALIKTADTWALSPRGALNAAKDYIGEKAKEGIQEGAKWAKGAISDLIDAGAEKVQVKMSDYVDDMTIAIKGQINEIIGSAFSAFEDAAVGKLDEYLKQGKDVASSAASFANEIINQADQKARAVINGTSDTIRPIVSAFYESYLASKLTTMKTEITNSLSSIQDLNAGDIMLKIQKSISKKVEEALDNLENYVNSKISSLINDLKSKITSTADGYIDMAADKAMEVTNQFLDDTFGTMADNLPDMGGKTSAKSSLASIIAFNYGDYLKVFLFLNLCTNSDEVVARIGDVIQLNINNALADSGYTHPKKGSFKMADAFTYIQIEANVKLKTMFAAMPFFTDYSGKEGAYFTIKYKSLQGY